MKNENTRYVFQVADKGMAKRGPMGDNGYEEDEKGDHPFSLIVIISEGKSKSSSKIRWVGRDAS